MEFLKKDLKDLGFPTFWVTLTMKCITTIPFSVVINGKHMPSFSPGRGLRQGDLLSPYLIILCAKVFSGLIIHALERKALPGIHIARFAPEICYLFFVDDSIFFFRATKDEASEILKIINLYQSTSGQFVNMDKSELSFSRNVREKKKILI